MDRLQLTGITAHGYHGVYPNERERGQTFIADVTIWMDHTVVGISDNVADTINYVDLCQLVHDALSGAPHHVIESLARHIAQLIIEKYPQIYAVEVTIHKPQAPLPVPVADVQVTARMSHKNISSNPGNTSSSRGSDHGHRGSDHEYGQNRDSDPSPQPRNASAMNAPSELGIVISLGSNIDNSIELIHDALYQIPAIRKVSSLYLTKPWGNVDQPDFINCVAIARADVFSPEQWLTLAHRLEDQANRTRTHRWGPRTLDIDLIAFTDPRVPIIVSENLQIPHPLMQQRAFVLIPWLEIDAHATVKIADSIVSISDLIDNLTADERDGIHKISHRKFPP